MAHHLQSTWGLEGDDGLGATKVLSFQTPCTLQLWLSTLFTPIIWQKQTAFACTSTICQETCDRPKQYSDGTCVMDTVSSPNYTIIPIINFIHQNSIDSFVGKWPIQSICQLDLSLHNKHRFYLDTSQPSNYHTHRWGWLCSPWIPYPFCLHWRLSRAMPCHCDQKQQVSCLPCPPQWHWQSWEHHWSSRAGGHFGGLGHC